MAKMNNPQVDKFIARFTYDHVTISNYVSCLVALQNNEVVVEWLIFNNLLSQELIWLTSLITNNGPMIRYCKENNYRQVSNYSENNNYTPRILSKQNIDKWRGGSVSGTLLSKFFECKYSNLKVLIFLTNERIQSIQVSECACSFCGEVERCIRFNPQCYYIKDHNYGCSYCICEENKSIFDFGEQYILVNYFLEILDIGSDLFNLILQTYVNVTLADDYHQCSESKKEKIRARELHRERREYLTLQPRLKNRSVKQLIELMQIQGLELPTTGTGRKGTVMKRDYIKTISDDIDVKRKEWNKPKV